MYNVFSSFILTRDNVFFSESRKTHHGTPLQKMGRIYLFDKGPSSNDEITRITWGKSLNKSDIGSESEDIKQLLTTYPNYTYGQ